LKTEHIVLGLAGLGAVVYLVTRAKAEGNGEIIYVTAAEATALNVQGILGDFPLLHLLDGETVTGTDGNRYALIPSTAAEFF